jgi:PRTRC genetic system protein E
VIPAKAKEGEDRALTTPLSYTGAAEDLDRELASHLADYVDSHLELGSTLAEAKAEMDAAAKVAREKSKAAQQTSKPDASRAPAMPTASPPRAFQSHSCFCSFTSVFAVPWPTAASTTPPIQLEHPRVNSNLPTTRPTKLSTTSSTCLLPHDVTASTVEVFLFKIFDPRI